MNAYKRITIYYFSGTGNSENVARWFSDCAAKRSIPCAVTRITDIDRTAIPLPHDDALLVFVSPVHGFNYPPIMLRFIRRFPRSRNRVLLMNTRAGMLIGSWNVPGISGIAFYLSALMLKMKGYSIAGMVPVDLPSNWISIHPGLNERTVRRLHEKNKEKVMACAEKVISGKRDFRALRDIVQDVIVSPLSLGYYFIGRFMFAKTFYASKDCNGCDVCIKNCPARAIIKVDTRPFWTFNCESCMRCMGSCPVKAIETAHGFIIGYLLFSSTLTGLVIAGINRFLWTTGNGIIRPAVDVLLFLFFLGVLYRLIHYLMRFRFVERIMVYTSLTKYKFWGRRYKALKDF